MKNVIKNGFYATAWLGLLALNNITNALDARKTLWATSWDNGQGTDFVATLNSMLWYVVGLLYFVAVVFALYGGFQILTAGWDEEKVKKGKTSLINAVLGLIVIFLASNVISWIMSIFTTWSWSAVS